MPTIRQRKLAKAIIENSVRDKPLNKQELVASVGYSELSADKKATEILESKGTLEALDDYGFNEENAKIVVAEILLSKKADNGHRLKAASEVFKVRGSYAPEKSIVAHIESSVSELDNERLETIAKGSIS